MHRFCGSRGLRVSRQARSYAGRSGMIGCWPRMSSVSRGEAPFVIGRRMLSAAVTESREKAAPTGEDEHHPVTFESSKSDKTNVSENSATKVRASDMRRLLSLAKPEAAMLGGALVGLAVSSACNLALPSFVGSAMDAAEVIAKGGENNMMNVVKNMAAVVAVGSVASVARVACLNTAGEGISARLRRMLFENVIAQDISFYDKNRTGELVNRLATDTLVISKSVTEVISFGLRCIFSSIGGVCVMIYFSPKLTGVTLMVMPPVLIGAAVYGRYVKRRSKQVLEALGKTTEIAEEKFANVRTVRVFDAESREADRYGDEVLKVYAFGKQVAIAQGFYMGGVNLAVSISLMSLLYYGGLEVASGSLTIGALTSFAMYSGYSGIGMTGLSNVYSEAMKALGASERVFDLLDKRPSVVSGSTIPSMVDGRVDFRNVTFNYPSRPDVPVLKELNLTLEAGKVVAIAGLSGSGKSTIAHLLSRLYDPVDADGAPTGEILVDGVPVTELDLSWLRRSVGVVSQEPVLFAGTIKENILYGRPDATDHQVMEAAKKANAHSFISDFSDGYETYVGERGISLSGGQKQRVAIARAILKDPRILVLDEATSALDSQSEQLVQQALERLMSGRTSLVIAHRLSTIRKADSIAVLNNGSIVEAGSFEELMDVEGGVFKELVLRQLEN